MELDGPRRTEQQQVEGQHDGGHGVKAKVWEERKLEILWEQETLVYEADSPIQDADEHFERRCADRYDVLGVEQGPVQRQVGEKSQSHARASKCQADDGQELKVPTKLLSCGQWVCEKPLEGRREGGDAE